MLLKRSTDLSKLRVSTLCYVVHAFAFAQCDSVVSVSQFRVSTV